MTKRSDEQDERAQDEKGAEGKRGRARSKCKDAFSDETPITVFGHAMYRADLVKMVGLLVFFALLVLVTVLAWPLFSRAFSEGGVDEVISQVRQAGPWGFLILLAAQLLQIVVAFIPGEVVQVAAGMLYGPWLGALVVLVGCVLASWFIYSLVHRLGKPFVKRMVPEKYLHKLDDFERSGKMDLAVFVLFLIPGMPKDTLTYLVPLTDMRKSSYLIITTIARTPGVLLSTYASSGLVDGNFTMVAVVVGVILALCALGMVFRDNLMSLLNGNGVGDLRKSVRSLGGLRAATKVARDAKAQRKDERKSAKDGKRKAAAKPEGRD